MKELTIEEKLEEAKMLYKDANADQRYVLESLFPELAEIEDVRIRKRIIQALRGDVLDMEETTKALAWLERQGEHANFRNKIQIGDKVTRNEDGVLVNLSQLNRVAKKDEKQGEQKPAEEYNITGISSNKSQGKLGEIIKNLKTTWSEKDEVGLANAMWAIEQARTIAKDENDMGNLWYAERWLKSLKDRVQPQPKQEWGEEDEDYINDLIKHFSQNERLKNTKEDIVIWLKSLKLKKQWKPSKEQMEALWNVYEGGEKQSALASLYNDLKKF